MTTAIIFIPLTHYHNYGTMISKIPVIPYHVRNFYESGKFRINFTYHIPIKSNFLNLPEHSETKYIGKKQNWWANQQLLKFSTVPTITIMLFFKVPCWKSLHHINSSNKQSCWISPSTSLISSKVLSYSQDSRVKSPDISLQNDPSSSHYCLTWNSYSMLPTIIA
jgi:hypothetical protein